MAKMTLLEETKVIIRSMLIAEKEREPIKIDQLDRLYFASENRHIPFARLGYKSLEDFLNGMPDVAVTLRRGYDVFVKGVITKETAHINNKRQTSAKFVSNDKSGSSGEKNQLTGRMDSKWYVFSLYENVNAYSPRIIRMIYGFILKGLTYPRPIVVLREMPAIKIDGDIKAQQQMLIRIRKFSRLRTTDRCHVDLFRRFVPQINSHKRIARVRRIIPWHRPLSRIQTRHIHCLMLWRVFWRAHQLMLRCRSTVASIRLKMICAKASSQAHVSMSNPNPHQRYVW